MIQWEFLKLVFCFPKKRYIRMIIKNREVKGRDTSSKACVTDDDKMDQLLPCGETGGRVTIISFTAHVQSLHAFKAQPGWCPLRKSFPFLSVWDVYLVYTLTIVPNLPLSALHSNYICVLSPTIFKCQRVKC